MASFHTSMDVLAWKHNTSGMHVGLVIWYALFLYWQCERRHTYRSQPLSILLPYNPQRISTLLPIFSHQLTHVSKRSCISNTITASLFCATHIQPIPILFTRRALWRRL